MQMFVYFTFQHWNNLRRRLKHSSLALRRHSADCEMSMKERGIPRKEFNQRKSMTYFDTSFAVSCMFSTVLNDFCIFFAFTKTKINMRKEWAHDRHYGIDSESAEKLFFFLTADIELSHVMQWTLEPHGCFMPANQQRYNLKWRNYNSKWPSHTEMLQK